MTHLGNALKAECFLGRTFVSQMKMLCILASTSAAMCYGPPSQHDKKPTLVGKPRSLHDARRFPNKGYSIPDSGDSARQKLDETAVIGETI